MATWNIDYPGTMGVVQRTASSAREYEGLVGRIDAALSEDVLGSLEQSGSVVDALARFGQEVMTPSVLEVLGHSASAIRGTADAANAYAGGDLTMAATAQQNASAVTYPDAPGTTTGR